MTTEQQRTEIRRFFDRPGQEVASELSSYWFNHSYPSEPHRGQAKVLGLQSEAGIRFFTIDEMRLFEDSYTRDRWPKSRSLAIASLDPGEVIAFMSQGQHVLTFIKTQGAENIMLQTLKEVDRFGDPLAGKEHTLTASNVARIVGLRHGMRGQLTPVHFRRERAFLLATGARELTDEELETIEEELRAEFESLSPEDNPGN